MPKLIDLEKIKPIDFPSVEMDGLDVVRYLNTLPTVDAVEVVRCKDCKHYENVCGYYYCFHQKMEAGWNSEGGESLMMDAMDFCSYGERKTDG